MRLLLLTCVFATASCSGDREDSAEVREPEIDDLSEVQEDDTSELVLDAETEITPECATNADCEGHFGRLDQCETSACNSDTGRCVRLAATNGLGCIDRDFCTTADRCIEGRCVGGPPLDCDDGNPCTLDQCEPRKGCQHSLVDGRCDDGNACTNRDVCIEGRCRGERRECDDNDPCTEDACDTAKGCTFTSLPDCR